MGELAARRGENERLRLNAALAAGTYGKAVLIDLARSARSDDHKLRAAEGLRPLDMKAYSKALQQIAKHRRSGDVRIRAAALPPTAVALDALDGIVHDVREPDAGRFDAAERPWATDKRRGRQAMQELVNAQRVGKATRDRALAYLRR